MKFSVTQFVHESVEYVVIKSVGMVNVQREYSWKYVIYNDNWILSSILLPGAIIGS